MTDTCDAAFIIAALAALATIIIIPIWINVCPIAKHARQCVVRLRLASACYTFHASGTGFVASPAVGVIQHDIDDPTVAIHFAVTIERNIVVDAFAVGAELIFARMIAGATIRRII